MRLQCVPVAHEAAQIAYNPHTEGKSRGFSLLGRLVWWKFEQMCRLRKVLNKRLVKFLKITFLHDAMGEATNAGKAYSYFAGHHGLRCHLHFIHLNALKPSRSFHIALWRYNAHHTPHATHHTPHTTHKTTQHNTTQYTHIRTSQGLKRQDLQHQQQFDMGDPC